MRRSEPDGRARGGLFIWLSGADREVLAKVPRERNKFTALGGVVLMTATMAAASFTFAMVIGVRAPIPVAVVIGLLWGLAIMNLDRWLVTATPRRDHWYQNLAATLPRVVLALIMGLVISTPVVLWVFQREIKAGINTIQAENRKAFEGKLAATDAQIKADEDKIAALQATADGGDATQTKESAKVTQLRAKEKTDFDEWQKWLNLADCERDGRANCSSGVPGKGPNWRDDKARADELKTIYDQDVRDRQAAEKVAAASGSLAQKAAQGQIDVIDKDVEALRGDRAARVAQFDIDNKNDDGILSQLDALSELTDKRPALKSAYIVLMLFITAIEILPVLSKFLMSLGEPTPYDEAQKIIDRTRYEQARIDGEHAIEVSRVEAEEQLARERVAIREHAGIIVDAQSQVVRANIDDWMRSKLRLEPRARSSSSDDTTYEVIK
jgi:hypothetical protein